MPTIRLGTVCLCLLSAPFLSFAQTDHDAKALLPEDSATALSTNEAADSLNRPLARALMADFSPLISYFFTDQPHGNPQDHTKQNHTKQDQTKPPVTNPGAH